MRLSYPKSPMFTEVDVAGLVEDVAQNKKYVPLPKKTKLK